MGSTDLLCNLLAANKAWLLDRVLGYAKEHGYTRYAATQLKAWEISIIGLTDSILEALRTSGTIPELGPDDFAHDTPIVAFGKEEVRRHRSRGVTLPMFLGLVKYYRQSYLDLVRGSGLDARTEKDCLVLVERFFDYFEIGCSVEWNSLSDDQKLEELQTRNRLMTNEKNKYFTIFESLYDPVILVDGDLRIENVNQAAAELFDQQSLVRPGSQDRHPVIEVFPWLIEQLTRFAAGDDQEIVFEKPIDTPTGERSFQVKMKTMLDATEKYRGTVVILNDLTERKKKEEALVLNEAIERWVNTLVDIGHRVSKMEGVDDVLPLLVESARSLLRTEFAALGMWNRESDSFEVRCVAGSWLELSKAPMFYGYPPGHNGACGDLGCSCLDEIGARLYVDLCGRTPHGIEVSCLSVPLVMDAEVVGALWVGRAQPFPPSATVVLESLANQAVIAVEHTVMAGRMRSLAIVDERTRIAREMHDGLAQILGFLNLEMQSLEVLVRQNRLEETVAELRNARARILEAHAEVRENILSLRTALSGDHGPVSALEDYLREFGAQAGVQVHLVAAVDDDVPLSSMAAVQLVRIVQGALANVRLHAQAANLWVEFALRGEDLTVVIEDDGVGFDPAAVRADIGLQSMRERTASVGGSLTIDSSLGEGTRLCLRVPLDRGGRELQPAE
ncbi:MAG: histidine kinase [Thermoleophilia bacterium]|nr:histidine kinase [Thermoleophilia bacterium]